MRDNKGRFKKGHVPSNAFKKGQKGLGRKKGSIPWNKGKKGWISSGSFKKGNILDEKRLENMFGSKNPNWKGGVAGKLDSLRHSREYKLWRISVFQRDRFACVFCGYKSKGVRPPDIHADHIKPFIDYPELRFAIDNGRTLCLDCHRKTETWGFRKNIKKK